MAEPEDVVVSRLREMVATRVAESSRRAIARELGMSARGLELFLAGSRPQARTLGRLRRWYAEQSKAGGSMLLASADEAIRLLVQRIPEQERAAALQEVREYFRDLYMRWSVPVPPEWR